MDTLTRIEVPNSTTGGPFGNGWSQPVPIQGVGQRGEVTYASLLAKASGDDDSSNVTDIAIMVFYGDDEAETVYAEDTNPASVIQPRRILYDDAVPTLTHDDTEAAFEASFYRVAVGIGPRPYRLRGGRMFAAIRARTVSSSDPNTTVPMFVNLRGRGVA